MDDKVTPSKNTKNNDCYFYYYSSCSKGDACPFRHEPSALRNETVCIFWLQGNCNKANCIFRHMELTKQRDKIQCWFETQPGGCKKPHCSFQHQNILDHPREEDIKKKPDLILPVRKDEIAKDEAEVVSSEETERPFIYPRNEGGSVSPPTLAPYGAIPRNPIIVPLQDGESDSESVSGSPYKRVNPELSAQLEWELRKLRQIQADEADIIGYVFADDMEEEEEDIEEEERFEDESMNQNQEVEEYVVEEILEVEEEPDTAHRRLLPPQRNSLHSAQVKSYPDPVLSEYRKTILNPHVGDLKGRRKVQISERLGGVASRALAETLGTSVQIRKPAVKRLTNRNEDQVNVSARTGTGTERFSPSPSKKISLLDRLGTRHSKEPSSRPLRSPEEEIGVVDRSIATRIMAIRNSQDGPSDDNIPDSKPLSTSSFDKAKGPNLDFTVKSLSAIRAEKQRKVTVQNVQPGSKATKLQSHLVTKNGTKLLANSRKVIESPKEEANSRKVIEFPKEEGSLKILSLSEIKARQVSTSKNNSSSTQPRRRCILPVSFGREENQKSGPKCNSSSVQPKKRSISPISFGMKNNQKSVPKINPNASHPKRSVSPVSLHKDNAGYKKICLSPHSHESVQSPLGSEITEQKVCNMGMRKITINRPLAKKSVESRGKEKLVTDVVDAKLKAISTDNSKNNNNVPLGNNKKVNDSSEKQRPSAVISDVLKDSKEKLLDSSLNRSDSFIDEEEELLLGGEMFDDEDEIDEAALLL